MGAPTVDLGGQPTPPNTATFPAVDAKLLGGIFKNDLSLKPGAPDVYTSLKSVLDPQGQQTLNDAIRGQLLQTNDAGLVAKGSTIRDFLDHPYFGDPNGAGIFSQGDATPLRLATAGDDILNASGRPAGIGATLSSRIVRPAMGALAGVAGSTFLPVFGHAPLIQEGLGALMGTAGEMGAEHLSNAFNGASELSGAPDAAGWLNAPKAVSSAAQGVAPVANISLVQIPPPLPPPPPQSDIFGAAPDWSAAVPGSAAPQRTPTVTSGHDPFAAYRTDPYADRGSSPPDTSQDDVLTAPAQANGGRIGRSTGGKTDNLEPLLQRLLARAEQAKKAEKAATKPLLKVPDTAIAKALDIAQRAF